MGMLDELDKEARGLLERYHFDFETFSRLATELREGRFPMERNVIDANLKSPQESDLVPWPALQTSWGDEAAAIGQEMLDSGQVGVLILNGGMATRFGGVVKGAVEAVEGLSFLGLRLLDIAHGAPGAPIFLLNSFATEEATAQHLEEHDYFGVQRSSVHSIAQNIAIRLTPKGEIFHDANGRPSFYAPGHGDVFEALNRSQAFKSFVAAGGKDVVVSNVDNVVARISPQLLGAHRKSKAKASFEVAPRNQGDAGGAPLWVNDHIEIVEGFRAPKSFNMGAVPVFNTNTAILSVDAVNAKCPLNWYRADKRVDQKPVVQFERLMGEITAFVPSAYLRVPRDDDTTRFLPVKTPSDFDDLRPLLHKHTADLVQLWQDR